MKAYLGLLFRNGCVILWMYLDLFFILSGPTVSSIRKHILRYSHLDRGIGGTNGDTCIFYILKMCLYSML